MNEHAGFGCLLSVAIVVGFVLVFHEHEVAQITRVRPVINSHPQVATSPKVDNPLEPSLVSPSLVSPSLVSPSLVSSTNPPVAIPIVAVETAAAGSPLTSAPTVRLMEVQPPTSTSSALSESRMIPVEAGSPESVLVQALPGPVSRVDAPPISTPIPLLPAPATKEAMPGQPMRSRPRPLGSITIIEKGERLVDVAIRIYGSAEATSRIWKANRDRLASIDAPLSEGWLLRTP